MVRKLLAATIAMLLVASVAGAVGGQGESPPSVEQFLTYDPSSAEYSLNLEVLTPVGNVVTEPPPGWPLSPPEFMRDMPIGDSEISPFMMVYNRYVSPEGYYVLVPTLYTAVVMSVMGSSPFDVQPSGMVINRWVGIAGYLGWMESIGYSRDDVLAGDWKEDPEFWTGLFLAINDPKSPLHEGTLFLPPAVLLYTCDPTNPADCTRTTNAGEPGGSPQPPPASRNCPAPSAMQAEIRATGGLVDPPYPVVVGQDRSRRGADLKWHVEIPPVIYTWYEEVIVGTQTVCAYDPTGTSNGCPAPGSQYDEVTGSASGWHSFMASGASAGSWRARAGEPEITCVEHVEMYADRLQWVRTFATLTAPSREWILDQLAARYPGARLYQPDWTWLPPVPGSVLVDKTFAWEWTASQIAFRDPGEYQQSVAGSTTGTPVTAPRSFNLSAGHFSVWLHEATLSR